MEHIYYTLTLFCEKTKMVSLASLIMKNIIVFPIQSKFPIKLICCVALGSATSVFCLLKSIAINLQCSLQNR